MRCAPSLHILAAITHPLVTRECGARLYAPLKGDEIECQACGEVWPREKWLRLGDLMEAS